MTFGMYLLLIVAVFLVLAVAVKEYGNWLKKL
jgi:hypothetical protein